MIAKKKHAKVYGILLAVLIITLWSPAPVHASVKSDMKPLLNAMHNFVYYSVYHTVGTESKLRKNYTIKMNNQNMLTASALSTKFYNNEVLEKHDEDPCYVIYKLSSSKLKKWCSDLFGKTAPVSTLKNKREPHNLWFLFRQSGYPCLYVDNTETDSDLIRTSLSVKRDGSGIYTVKEGVYFGHWGAIVNKTAATNYVVTYKIKKNSNSSFGYVFKSMKIKRTGEVPGIDIPITS